MAAAALASDVEVVMGFQGDGVELVARGVAETVEAPRSSRRSPSSCATSSSWAASSSSAARASRAAASRPDDLVEGAEVVAAGRFIAEITSATNSLVY